MNFAYPFFQVQFRKDGTVFQAAEVDALVSALQAGANAPTDLIVMCHGWNNNMDDAKTLYAGLTQLIRTQVEANGSLGQRRFAVCGVLWPSKKFEDSDLIPAGAAALNDAVTVDLLKQKVDGLKELYTGSAWPAEASATAPAEFDEIRSLMNNVENDPNDQRKAVDLVRELLPESAKSSDDASDDFFDLKASLLVQKLAKQLNPPAIPAGAGAALLDPFATGTTSGLGGAAGFRDVLGGIKSGFSHLLNYATYYTMKARAGTVGTTGVAPLLVKMRDSRPELRLHLIGHSFGCRVVAAALQALPTDEKYKPDTVMLLQGAFSHNGFADASTQVQRGAFRDVIEKRKVRGAILITHTRNDKAVGTAYPIASRMNGVVAAALGDENDKYGGLGRNGTQTRDSTREGVPLTLLAVDADYPFTRLGTPSTPFNLKADDYIKGHSDLQHPEVAYAFVTAVAAK